MKKKKVAIAIQAILLGSAAMTAQVFAAEQNEAVDEAAEQNTAETRIQDQPVVEDQEENKIVLTGSRIRRDSFSISTPLVTVDRDAIDDSGRGSLQEILYDSVPALTAETSNTSSQSNVSVTGLSTIALRKLGVDRTLTLIDGRRTVSNSYSGNYVSLSTIPSGMVKKVEIIEY